MNIADRVRQKMWVGYVQLPSLSQSDVHRICSTTGQALWELFNEDTDLMMGMVRVVCDVLGNVGHDPLLPQEYAKIIMAYVATWWHPNGDGPLPMWEYLVKDEPDALFACWTLLRQWRFSLGLLGDPRPSLWPVELYGCVDAQDEIYDAIALLTAVDPPPNLDAYPSVEAGWRDLWLQYMHPAEWYQINKERYRFRPLVIDGLLSRDVQ